MVLLQVIKLLSVMHLTMYQMVVKHLMLTMHRTMLMTKKEAEGGTSKKSNPATAKAVAGDQAVIRTGTSVKEDVDALLNGEELSEEFRAKAETIFEAAVMTRV
jgi:hypothetical protein